MANPHLRALLRWRKWAKKDWAIAAVGFTLIVVFALSLISDSRRRVNGSVTNPSFGLSQNDDLVDLTLLRNAKDRGAFCLDGSLPGYHFQKGFGSGSNNWLLHIEGGGWCNTMSSCSQRKMTALGSSKYMDRQIRFSGILSSDPAQNPDFFSWNKVKIRYCDGASLAGHPENEIMKGNKLFFRGQLIWEALIDELLSIGLSEAKEALLSGCSAGGLATLIHCDAFRGLLPREATVKCLADASFFLDEKDILGNNTMRSFYHDVFQLQSVMKSLHRDCTTAMEPSRCFFPAEIMKRLQTPVFLVQPAYDFWQIQHVLVPEGSDPQGHWKRCRLSISNCDTDQMDILQGFRNSFLKSLSEFRPRREVGQFINSCFTHCQTWMSETWHSASSPKINKKTIAVAVADWFFDREVVKQIDCPYPCNPTCHNMDFTAIY
ncbi:pectin acetylesterase 5-like isoform X1 [Neltuma alba]|uniref:pectin acetylesterase 5-like isoform X1 n=1 Tax=Neltuma alba TaxID=207710 RepID=UPI0010A37C0F|nr:pectin acetylesterase 5-like isoform X1 [Prosopis alba]